MEFAIVVSFGTFQSTFFPLSFLFSKDDAALCVYLKNLHARQTAFSVVCVSSLCGQGFG